jgi:hypothetical protein
VRFLYSGICFNLALLLTTPNLAATAATPVTPVTQLPSIDRISIDDSNQTVIKGNGVEFTLPAGFTGGSPSSAATKAMVAATAKTLPSMAEFVKVFDSNPELIRAIATSTAPQQNPGVILVTRLPMPANTSLQDLQSAMSRVMPSMLPPEFKLVDNQIRNIGSRQIVQLEIDVNVRGVKLKESIGFIKEGDAIYQVTYVYASENSQQAISVFAQIINTFKATSQPSVPSPVI